MINDNDAKKRRRADIDATFSAALLAKLKSLYVTMPRYSFSIIMPFNDNTGWQAFPL